MYKRIQKLFQNFNGTTLLNQNINSSKVTLGDKLNEIIAFNHLNRLLPKDVYITNTGWSSSYVMIQHILNVIDANPSHNILEFGIGNSSLYIASSLQNNSRGTKYYGIDNTLGWIEGFKHKINKINFQGNCHIIHAEITENNQPIWYDINQIKQNIDENSKFGIVVIDGPYGKISEHIRSNGVEFILNKLSEDYIIFIDDTNREDGKLLVNKIREGLNQTSNVIDTGRYTVIGSKNVADLAPSQIW
jgi:16S rRNA G966 N2-methylase RsmD